MTVTAIVERWAPPGEGASIVARYALMAQRRERAWAVPDWYHVLESWQSPDHLLILSRWQSREAYQSWSCSSDGTWIESRRARPPVRAFASTLAVYERMERRAVAITAMQLQCPTAARADLLRLLQEEALPAVKQRPGLVFRHLYQDEADPCHLFLAHGWASSEDQYPARQALRGQFGARFDALGVSVTAYAGHTRLQADRLDRGR